jgi:hypothetical protein
VIVFAASDKGGTGRSVTSSNILYRAALDGYDACYVDLDLGSPTAGAIFGAESLARGTTSGRGLHSYLEGRVAEPQWCDLWTASDRVSLRHRPAGAGRLVLVPGDAGGGEFVTTDRRMEVRAGGLFHRLQEEFALTVVDLSAGRSYATQLALAVTGGQPVAEGRPVAAERTRWLIFHRWTMQHLVAAHGLVYGERGVLDTAVKLGHDRQGLQERLRFVRTAVVDPHTSDLSALRPPQLAWLRERHEDLQRRAAELDLGRSMLVGSIPMDPILQWHEQLLTDRDQFARQVANAETIQAFADLAARLLDPTGWERL